MLKFFSYCLFICEITDSFGLSPTVPNFANAPTDNNAGNFSTYNGLSAATLPNNASKISSKDYFGQHDLCESEIVKAERKYGIPSRLLMAIATVESGRCVEGSSKRPWPWTICAKGRGYYCSTKSAAIATVKRLMARGIRNIDVGCMQVNLLHHSKAFKDLEEAFSPPANVNYAAQFFTSLKRTYNSWTHAVGYYHSKDSRHYKPYCSTVYNTWNKVANRYVKETPQVERAASEKSKISFLPAFYSLADNSITQKLHELGQQTIKNREAPAFFVKREKQ